MNSWLNSVFDYLFGQRFEEIKHSLNLLTQRVNYLYTNVYHKTFECDDQCEIEEEKKEDVWMNDDDDDKGCLMEDKHQMYTTDQHADSFSFGVFVKPRLNNHTQLQYVSGTTDIYNTRKSLYTDMTQVVELLNNGGEYEVSAKKLKITARLEAAGFDVTHISDNSKIIKGHIDDVVDVITK